MSNYERSEAAEIWADFRDEKKRRKYRRRQRATREFSEAHAEAAKAGLVLVRNTEDHYQLSPIDGAWIMNLYPGTQRLYSDPNRRPPWIEVPRPWTLADVVKAAAKAEGKSNEQA
jgi:hypothetical protein